MKKPKILFFGNIFINNREKFEYMKDSFKSIYDENLFNSCVINVRGKYAEQSLNYLKSKKIINLYNIESPFGWYHDTFNITKNINFDYVFCWLEDFICKNKGLLNLMFKNIFKHKIDIIKYAPTNLNYNFKKFGENEIFYFKNIKKNEYKLKFRNDFIISYGSVINKILFFKILEDNDYNHWDKSTPFGFEKDAKQLKWLPLKKAYLKKKIFISIDDDHDIPGSSLHSQNQYKKIKNIRDKDLSHLRKYLQIGKRFEIKNLYNNFLKIFENLVLIFRENFSCKSFFKIIPHLKVINKYHIKIFNKLVNTNALFIIIFTLNKELEYLKQIILKKNVKLISNNIFNKKNDIINLEPIKFFKSKNSDKIFLSNGYLIKIKKIKKFEKKCLIIIDKKIYQILIKKNKNFFKEKNFLVY